jgi:mono/diheme cytochrome c family protein
MAWAVRAAQLNQRKTLIVLLLLTIAGGGMFMGVKYLEYSHKFHQNLVWGIGFYDKPHTNTSVAVAATPAALQTAPPPAPAPAAQSGDAVKGQALWMATCRSCHGPGGEGMPGQGKDIRASEFIAGKSDKDLVAFIKVGRMPFDKLNTTGIQMPPKGGNPLLTDADLVNIVAYVRTIVKPAAEAEPEKPAESPATNVPITSTSNVTIKDPAPATVDVATANTVKEEFYVPKAIVPPAAVGPAGLTSDWENPAAKREDHRASTVDPRDDPRRPANLHLFFGVYFLMTGLHGLHVLIGMGFIGWLTVRALLGHFTSAYFTPVDLVGLYWHVVDLIWIFLFPLLYLIH